MTEHHPRNPAPSRLQDAGDAVLDWYLEDLHQRVGPECLAVLVRVVQDACQRVSGDGQALLEVPGEDGWTPELQRECLSLLAVMITGQVGSHHLVEIPGPERSTGWLVIQAETVPPLPLASMALPPHSGPSAQQMGTGLERGLRARATA
ncbi:hypothetical protein [Streptomyces sp. H27-H5]|uniref:hypothetical protein n=1 Tax=Streptomyces sp. H27-H5 TaxID=2996460 RepID=UPI00226FF935|nr:hypothetical protein [Streptomyces sp. H27-H5]MCY0963104.1 hypothetical protein [Streptomyces sp. H27-H5]